MGTLESNKYEQSKPNRRRNRGRKCMEQFFFLGDNVLLSCLSRKTSSGSFALRNVLATLQCTQFISLFAQSTKWNKPTRNNSEKRGWKETVSSSLLMAPSASSHIQTHTYETFWWKNLPSKAIMARKSWFRRANRRSRSSSFSLETNDTKVRIGSMLLWTSLRMRF